eukprot:02819.XXX_18060_18176_1 [CDS] Oithona nana genome sequencing.
MLILTFIRCIMTFQKHISNILKKLKSYYINEIKIHLNM